MSMADFSGMTVLVSGATGGFGRRAAERFAAAGASLILSDRDQGALDALAAGLPGPAAALGQLRRG